MTGLLWTIVLALLLGESLFFVQAIAKQFVRLGLTENDRTQLPVLAATSLAVIAALVIQGDWRDAKNIAKSKRPDHIGAFLLGILTAIVFGGAGTSAYEALLSTLTNTNLREL